MTAVPLHLKKDKINVGAKVVGRATLMVQGPFHHPAALLVTKTLPTLNTLNCTQIRDTMNL